MNEALWTLKVTPGGFSSRECIMFMEKLACKLYIKYSALIRDALGQVLSFKTEVLNRR